MLLSGLVLTIDTALAAWLIALVTGAIVGVMRTLPSKAASLFGFCYVEFFRNMPLLVQLFLWFFVLPEVVPASWGLWLKQLPNAPFYTAAIGTGTVHVGAGGRTDAGRHQFTAARPEACRHRIGADDRRRSIATCCCRWHFVSSCRR